MERDIKNGVLDTGRQAEAVDEAFPSRRHLFGACGLPRSFMV